MPYLADPNSCAGCGACVDDCPSGAITMKNGAAVIDPEQCLDCGACEDACTSGAIKPES